MNFGKKMGKLIIFVERGVLRIDFLSGKLGKWFSYIRGV